MFRLLKQDGAARRGEFETVHGTIQTPVFMNVGTSAAIKGGVSSLDLANDLKTQVELCNTYHLHVRPGDEVVYKMSGLPLKRFFNTSGQIYREMELSKKLPDMSEDESFKLLASDGMIVKRPLLVAGDKVLTGFKEEDWAKVLL